MSKDERSLRILEKLDRLQRTGNRATAKFVAEEAVAYFARRKNTPKWLWLLAAGGAILVLLMMLAMWLITW